ncbi:hypothetical protein M0804_004185 [Polistes exclamans]|nr:hypothetical protein M0804_004185 [Polistes exclamans]
MSTRDASRLTVATLKELLQRRGISTSGAKAELMARLYDYDPSGHTSSTIFRTNFSIALGSFNFCIKILTCLIYVYGILLIYQSSLKSVRAQPYGLLVSLINLSAIRDKFANKVAVEIRALSWKRCELYNWLGCRVVNLLKAICLVGAFNQMTFDNHPIKRMILELKSGFWFAGISGLRSGQGGYPDRISGLKSELKSGWDFRVKGQARISGLRVYVRFEVRLGFQGKGVCLGQDRNKGLRLRQGSIWEFRVNVENGVSFWILGNQIMFDVVLGFRGKSKVLGQAWFSGLRLSLRSGWYFSFKVRIDERLGFSGFKKYGEYNFSDKPTPRRCLVVVGQATLRRHQATVRSLEGPEAIRLALTIFNEERQKDKADCNVFGGRRSYRAKYRCVIEETDPPGTKFFIPGKEAGSGPSLAALESRRLTVKLRDLLMGVEAERVRSSNLNGKVSGRIKRNIKGALRITEEMDARLGRSSGASSSNTEMVSQLRAEMNLVEAQKRNIEEECIKLRRELKKKEAIITTLQGETAASSQKRASGPLGRKAPANDERLEAARSSLTDIGSIMAVLRKMTKGMEVLQQSNRELWSAVHASANPGGRPEEETAQKTTAEGSAGASPHNIARVPDQHVPAPAPPASGGGFVEVVGRKKRHLQLRAAAAQQTRGNLEVTKGKQPGSSKETEGNKAGKKKKPRKKPHKKNWKRRIRETAAVSLVCKEAATYRDALVKARESINLKELGLETMTVRRLYLEH